MAKYGKRLDSTDKDVGWLGPVRTKDGYADMTEYSIGEPNSDETFRPSMVPGTHPADLNYLRETGDVPNDMLATSDRFAKKRIKEGKSPFYNSDKKEPKKMTKGGKVSKASSRGDGCAQRGKTRGKFR